MDEIAEALHTYWNSFEVPAYPENSIPDNAKLPYIVYRVQKGEMFETMTDYVQIFDDGLNTERIIGIAKQITASIGLSKRININSGHIILRGIRWQIRKDTEENSVANYGDFSIEYNTK